jgi:hypothetical protein
VTGGLAGVETNNSTTTDEVVLRTPFKTSSNVLAVTAESGIVKLASKFPELIGPETLKVFIDIVPGIIPP